MVNGKDEVLVKELVVGSRSWHDLPKEWDEGRRVGLRQKAIEEMTGVEWSVKGVEVVEAAYGRNCEQMMGVVRVPVGVVGPINFEGKRIMVPLATTEGALVASVQRGLKTINQGKVEVVAEEVGTTRSLVFRVGNVVEGRKVAAWIKENRLRLGKMGEETSNHLKLEIEQPVVVGRNLFLKLRGMTGEAMGMNMMTIAADRLASVIEKKTGIKCVSLSANWCTDKKPAMINVIKGRGMQVQAEVKLAGEVVERGLKVRVEELVEAVNRKVGVGSMLAGSMAFNGHYANMVAALFLATGQDIAQVVEGSLGITTAEVVGKDLYFSIWLPALMIGTVGGGTGLPDQKKALKMMGIGGGEVGGRQKLAKTAGLVVLAGELSLMGALASGDLSKAHQRLGRKK